jgi:alkylation response protein AidB-like acyl-CoA dehydrogenase
MSQHNTEHLDTEEQRAFRLKARDWMKGRLPPRRMREEPVMDFADKDLVDKDKAIQKALWDGGLAGITVPKEYGGQGLSLRFEDILHEEAEPYRLPWHFGNAFVVVLPTLLKHGSEMLKKRYIPLMLKGDHVWCQLLSEPSGGSDLAGVLTSAKKVGDKWVLNGSKVWTTGGNHSEMGLCLARTDPTVPKHAGLTWFLVDMKSPGMTINPLTLLNGTVDFCQEFLDNVEVPEDHVVGEVNGGWTVAQSHLAHDRAGMARGWHIGLRQEADAEHLELSPGLIALTKDLGLAQDPHARALVGEAFVLDMVQALTTRRVSGALMKGALPGAWGAVPSLLHARTSIRRSALMSELAGPVGVAVAPDGDGPRQGMSRVMTHRIGGGTLETQLNNVAERVLELPREPGPSRDTPFNQLRTNAMPQR